jgi:hypothetical protein
VLPEKLIRDAAATVSNSGIPLAFRKRVNPVGDERISAAGVLFVTPDGEALFLKRGGPGVGGHVGEWDLPGGGLDEGEEPVDAARRETLEEIGHLPHWDLAPLTRKTSDEGVDYATFGQRIERKFVPKLNRNEHTDYAWAPLDRPPEPLHPDLAEFLSHGPAGEAEDEAPRVCVNAEHDGPWFSVISLDGQTVYRNRNIPDHAELGDARVPVNPLIIAHEVAERAEMRRLLEAFTVENSCEPTDKEREAIYLKAHKTAGVPAERAKAKEMQVDWRAWNAWCRGEEAKVEKGPFVNPPDDADVKPIPHGHGQLEAADAEWNESDHPRRDDGKFGSGGGGSTSISLKAGGKDKHSEALADYLQDYTTNHFLRTGEISPDSTYTPEQMKRTIKLMDEAIAARKTSAPLTLYRGFGAKNPKDFTNKKGVLRDKAFLSTSTSEEAAREFSQGQYLAKIELPAGSNALMVDYEYDPDDPASSAHADQREVILPRGMRLQVVAADHGKKTVTMKPMSIAATDTAFAIALDRDSVRLEDIDGRLHVAVSNISKANICPYKGREIPDYEELGLEPDRVYQLLRDPEELAKAASSFNRVQLLRRHVPVTADDHKPHDVVGTTGSDAVFEHPYLKNSLAVWEQDAIEGIKSREKVELSCGYHYSPDMTPGVYEGEAYDGVMRDIVGNHVALVEDGRAGPDVVVGDSSENVKNAIVGESESLGGPEMSKMPTKFANLALQLTARALKPVLAADSKIDLMPIFKDVTSKNFNAKKIAAAVGAEIKGKLAKDASVEHLASLLDHLEHPSSDESVSGPEHRAMEAAAHGNSTLGIPQGVGQEFSDADKGHSFGDQAAHLGEFLKGKGLDEETVKAAVDMAYAGIGEGGRAKDEDKETAGADEETEEEKKAREAKEKEGKDNMPDRVKTSTPTAQDKKAFDEAVKLAVDTALKASQKTIRDEVRDNERKIRIALDEVRPYVGELPAALGYDSATQVYRQALKMRGVDGVDDIHKSALATILKLLPKSGAAPARNGDGLAMDAASDAEMAKEYPGIENVLVG